MAIIKIDTNSLRSAKLRAGVIPKGAKIIGQVVRDGIHGGAAVKLASGHIVEISASVLRTLPEQKWGKTNIMERGRCVKIDRL